MSSTRTRVCMHVTDRPHTILSCSTSTSASSDPALAIWKHKNTVASAASVYLGAELGVRVQMRNETIGIMMYIANLISMRTMITKDLKNLAKNGTSKLKIDWSIFDTTHNGIRALSDKPV